MAKSSKRGSIISAKGVEVLGLTPFALYLAVNGREYMLDYQRFPWFRQASIEQVSDVKLSNKVHLHWPTLDLDLHVESLASPERYPLVSKKSKLRERP